MGRAWVRHGDGRRRKCWCHLRCTACQAVPRAPSIALEASALGGAQGAKTLQKYNEYAWWRAKRSSHPLPPQSTGGEDCRRGFCATMSLAVQQPQARLHRRAKMCACNPTTCMVGGFSSLCCHASLSPYHPYRLIERSCHQTAGSSRHRPDSGAHLQLRASCCGRPHLQLAHGPKSKTESAALVRRCLTLLLCLFGDTGMSAKGEK
jgi:hypothetical protein